MMRNTVRIPCAVAIAVAAHALAACSAQENATFTGYAEADMAIIGAPEGGWITEVIVRAGDTVAVGDLLFRLDPAREEALVAQARARLAQAEAQAADIATGGRPQEIAVRDAEVRRADAALALAEREFARADDLARRGVAPERSRDTARNALANARAQLAQAREQRELASLPAREEQRRAAEENVRAARAALAEAEWRLAQRNVTARLAGRVDDILRDPGEFAGPGAGVLRLLPENAIKVRFFVPQDRLSALAPGASVSISCDGCGEPVSARVTYIASEAEYTPPVIFSVENRQKLVFAVEAVPERGTALRPGQPVDVRIAPAGPGA